MTNVMHEFLINLSIYFCLTFFGLSISPSSEAGVNFGSGASRLELLPTFTSASEDGLIESPKHVRQK
jgi:hypothetical protein